MTNTPFISVIMPIRNESDFIERSIRALMNCSYPADKVEFIIVDGMSDDGTREIVQNLVAEDERVRLLDNPQKIVPHAMNTGIRSARGDIIIRVDGHAEVSPSFLQNSVEVLLSHSECWIVGGPIETVSSTPVGRTIAAAMSTRVGVGNAMFRLANYEGYVDTIAFGAHWRWVFDRAGLFDEELVRNQDDEFNARVIAMGGRIYMSQSIRSRYFPRSSLGKLWRQYYQYGFWRIRTIQKLGKPATMRQLVPLLFVVGLIFQVGMAALWKPARWALLAYLAAYCLGLLAGAAEVSRRVGLVGLFMAPVVFAILHFAYGLGCLHGLLWFVLLRRSGSTPAAGHALSR